MSEMEIVSAADKGAELRAIGASGCPASQALPAGVDAVVPPIDSSVEIKSLTKVSGVKTTSPGIDSDVATCSEIGPGMLFPGGCFLAFRRSGL